MSEKPETAETRRLRCVAVVWKRDTLRIARGSKRRFMMHYSKDQCSRAAVCEDRLCRQHSLVNNPMILETPYYEFL